MSDQVEEIKSKVDIVSVIGEHVKLTKAGSNYKGLCPFHSEKTPSFMVTPELQIFKCFGCQEGGDVISFVQKYEGIEFYDALKILAERAGVELKKQSAKFSQKDKIYEINALAKRFYQYILHKHQAGKIPLEYLIKDRKLKSLTIKEFELGYSPMQGSAVLNFLRKKGYSLKDLELAGIAFVRGNRGFDRFNGRIIFPLHDHRGNTIGFAGRMMPEDKRDLGKYINTSETEVYKKSQTLYGYDKTRMEIKKQGFAVVVEGELDMISTWQADIKNTVAIKGSALTPDQVKLIKRITDRIVLALDSDFAGDEAARRGIDIAQEAGLDVRVARLGKFKDPDDMAKEDPEGLKKAIEEAVDVWDFIIEDILERNNRSGSGTSKVSRELVPILASITDKIVQAYYVGLVAQRLNVNEEAVAQEVMNLLKNGGVRKKEYLVKRESPKQKTRQQMLEERLLSLAFQLDTNVLEETLYDIFKSPVPKKLFQHFLSFTKINENYSIKTFSDYLPPELKEAYAALILEDNQNFVDDPNSVERELNLLIKELKILDLKVRLQKITIDIAKYEKENNENKLKMVEEKFNKLSRELSKLTG